MKKLVLFASGSGTNFQAIIDAVDKGEIRATIAGLITDNPDAGAIDRAKKHDIPVEIIEFSGDNHFSSRLEKKLIEWSPDLIVLAGYLKKIPSGIVDKYPDQIINIHPSLLPKYGGRGYYGERVHKAVLEAGDTMSGCTVHFVNNEYDRGNIIAQKKVPVKSSDSPSDLAGRVLKEEHKLLPQVVEKLINKKTQQ